MRPTTALVPVTIVGGYLGAGKTTLLNELLDGDHGRRLAVLVNDFGSVNIDAELIAARSGDTVTLENGCICCSIADALGDALDQVLAIDPLPDQIVIEASGAADPAKVAYYGQGWPGCRLDAVVVLADAETIRRQATDEFVGELVVRQLASADVVVLSKIDLVGHDAVDEVRTWVRDRTGDGAVVLGADHGRIDPALLLDPDITRQPGSLPPLVGRGVRFDSHTVELPTPVRTELVESALEAWPDGIVRVKGIVDVDGLGLAVVQRVGRRWSITPWPADRPRPEQRCIVLIGIAGVVDLAEQARRGLVL
ncbi:MAG: CobW family GTP-binding protein [Acidimicrobiales bacterium]